MPRRLVATNERIYLFSPDCSPSVVDRVWALAKVRLIDELSGLPPAGATSITSTQHGIIARVTNDGIGGVVGIPRNVLPHLDAQSYGFQLTVTSEGYVTQDVNLTVERDPEFPTRFVPPAVVDVFLHREPTVILGRTVRIIGNSTSPAAGATVSITGMWRTPPPANAIVPHDVPNLVSLSPPLYVGRKTPAGHLRRRNLPPTDGDKTLLHDVAAGGNNIRLSDRENLVVGDILLIDAGQPDLIEFVAIKSIVGASTTDQPATIVLDHPLGYGHRTNAVVQRTDPQPRGDVRRLSVAALAGDTCVFLKNLTGLLAGANEVELIGGSANEGEVNAESANEYHRLRTFTVTSDADGYYRLPPVSRVGQIILEAKKTVGQQAFKAEQTFRPDYSKRENVLDLTLTLEVPA